MCNSLVLLALGLLLLAASCGSPIPTRESHETLLLYPSPTLVPAPTHAAPAHPNLTAALAAYPRPSLTSHPPSPALTDSTAGQAIRGTTTPSLTPAPAPPAVTFSTDGRYAFPVAGDLALMTWTHYHWDGGNAVDVEAARHLPGDSDEFNTFIHLPVAAVITGTISIADNYYGGLALLLYGDDGYTYYYGHLSEQWVEDSQPVAVGDWLGRIGNTGHNSQYIEPHLHFSIATHNDADWRWEPDVNAAERFLTWFDLPWQDLNIPDYPVDHVAGWPLDVPAGISRDFSVPLAQNPDQGSIDIMPTIASDGPIPIYATLTGEVNVNRATVMGLRVQITNRPAKMTVVYSFLLGTDLADGDVVQPGDLVGYIDPVIGLNYMLFVRDVSTDPTSTLGAPPQQ